MVFCVPTVPSGRSISLVEKQGKWPCTMLGVSVGRHRRVEGSERSVNFQELSPVGLALRLMKPRAASSGRCYLTLN